MAFTRHGHHIWGSTKEEIGPGEYARCGGPGVCTKCSEEESAWRRHNLPVNESKDNHYLLKYFAYGHLAPQLQSVSKPFCDLAFLIDSVLPAGSEQTTALRKLLEAKDAAVRAALDIK